MIAQLLAFIGPKLLRFIPSFRTLSIAAVLVGTVGGYLYGYHNAKLSIAHDQTKAVQAAIQKERVLWSEAMKSLTDYYASRDKPETKILEKKVIEYVQSPAAAVECFNVDELQLISEILAD